MCIYPPVSLSMKPSTLHRVLVCAGCPYILPLCASSCRPQQRAGLASIPSHNAAPRCSRPPQRHPADTRPGEEGFWKWQGTTETAAPHPQISWLAKRGGATRSAACSQACRSLGRMSGAPEHEPVFLACLAMRMERLRLSSLFSSTACVSHASRLQ
jgi:hypothetical protein